ncbi:hypothetical protein COB55_00905 [Candidatus Wolfebacteria bacterium]|nr:MAG: hypothetical protein COB55_00905 [Candidatus Wolfebacteria bacterium]
MSLFSSSKNKHDIILALDIGSSRISAALIELNAGFTPKILFSVNHVLETGQNLSLVKLANEMSATLTIVLHRVESDGVDALLRHGYCQESIKKVAVTIAAPWVHSETRTITYEQGTPFTVSPTMLSSLVNQEVEEIIKKEATTKASLVHKPEVLEVIDQSVMRLLLNGYESQPEYKGEVDHLEASVFVSISPKKILNTIRRHIDLTIGVRNIIFNAFPVIASTVLRDMVSVDDSFIVLSVGGEMSEVMIMHTGILEKTLPVAVGRNHIIRNVGASLNISPTQAHSLLRLYAEGRGDAKSTSTINTVLGSIVDNIVSIFDKQISEYPENHLLPSQVFVISDEEVLSWMNVFSGSSKPKEIVVHGQTFSVALLGEHTFSSFCNFSEGAYRSPFLSTEALFFNKMYTDKEGMDK